MAGAIGCASLLLCSPSLSLAQIAPESCEKFLGNIYSNSQRTDFEEYWNQVTPENAGKWGSVERTRDVMDWTELDAAYALAKDNGFPFRFHVLIWGNQQPEWIKTLPAEEQLEEIKEWFAAVAERYPDIDYLEVVNEPTNDPPNKDDNGGGNYIEALGGTGTTGWDWVINSFKLAREYFPDTKLVLNDFNVTNKASTAQKYVGIINLLKEEELIDIVGIQGHAFETFYASPAETKKNLNTIAATDLPIMITEMDIDGVDSNGNISDETQLAEYKEIFPIFWEHPSVVGITLWGWRPGLWRNKEAAYLVDQQGTERPALQWLKTYLQNQGSKFCGTTTGIKESKLQQEIQVYPNPAASGAFTLQLTNDTYDQLQIININGQTVKTLSIQNQAELKLKPDLKPGIYLLRFSNHKGTVTKRIVVQ